MRRQKAYIDQRRYYLDSCRVLALVYRHLPCGTPHGISQKGYSAGMGDKSYDNTLSLSHNDTWRDTPLYTGRRRSPPGIASRDTSWQSDNETLQ